MTKKDVATMEAERRELDRQIRAAKRAETKAAKEEFLSCCGTLGQWLATTVGAETQEDVTRLRELLEEHDVLAKLRHQLTAKVSDLEDVQPTEPAAQGPGQTQRPSVDVRTQRASDSAGQFKRAGGDTPYGH